MIIYALTWLMSDKSGVFYVQKTGQQPLTTRSEEQLPQQQSPANGVATPRRGWFSLLCNSYTMGTWAFIAPRPEGAYA